MTEESFKVHIGYQDRVNDNLLNELHEDHLKQFEGYPKESIIS